jgi:hypothetical protein
MDKFPPFFYSKYFKILAISNEEGSTFFYKIKSKVGSEAQLFSDRNNGEGNATL